jgi:hypothetical protein
MDGYMLKRAVQMKRKPTPHPKLLTRHDDDADWHGADGPKGPLGCNNGRLHAETAHPDEKQHHMVSKNMPNYPRHIPNYLLVMMMMPTGTEPTAQRFQ